MAVKKYVFISLRILLSVIYLWVVADRIGILGPAGNPGVVWGDFQIFLDYTASLNPWFPRGLSDILGILVTILEVVLAILLTSGYRLKEAAMASCALLLIFTFSMLFSQGFTAAADFIVFTIVLLLFSALILWDKIKGVNQAHS